MTDLEQAIRANVTRRAGDLTQREQAILDAALAAVRGAKVIDHPEQPSLYEQQIGHRLDDQAIKEAMERGTPGLSHPDNCPDCAVNPKIAKMTELANRATKETEADVAAFFSVDVDRTVLMNLVMTAWIGMTRRLEEYLPRGSSR